MFVTLFVPVSDVNFILYLAPSWSQEPYSTSSKYRPNIGLNFLHQLHSNCIHANKFPRSNLATFNFMVEQNEKKNTELNRHASIDNSPMVWIAFYWFHYLHAIFVPMNSVSHLALMFIIQTALCYFFTLHPKWIYWMILPVIRYDPILFFYGLQNLWLKWKNTRSKKLEKNVKHTEVDR